MGFVLRRAGAPEGVGLRGMGEGLTLQEGVEEAGAPLKGGEAGEPGGEGQQGEHGRQDRSKFNNKYYQQYNRFLQPSGPNDLHFRELILSTHCI